MTGLTYQKDVFARLYGALEATRGLASYIRATHVPIDSNADILSAVTVVTALAGGSTVNPTTLSTLQLLIECDRIHNEIKSSFNGSLVSSWILHPMILEAVLNE